MGKRKPRGRPPDPDEDWNDEDLPVEDGQALCKQVYDKIEEAPSAIWDKAFDFFEGVQKSISEIGETIASSGKFTEGQKTALQNIEAGVDKWLENDE